MAVVCQVLPASLSFGIISIGSYSNMTFRITNTGSGTLSGTISLTDDDFSIDGDANYSLTDGEYKDFTIRFAPGSAGIKSCTVDTGDAICSNVSCSGGSKELKTVPYFRHGVGVEATTVYLDNALIVPYPIRHEQPESLCRTEDRKLKVYKHSLAGDKKRIWQVSCSIDNSQADEHNWNDLEAFYWETIQGAKEQFTFGDAHDKTYTVRLIDWAPKVIAAKNIMRVRMILEEDYA